MRRALTPLATRVPETLSDFRRDLENLFGFALGEDRENGWLTEFTPSVNVAETAKAYEVSAEIPGMQPENINVELDRDTLVISGERKEEQEEKGKTFHRIERKYGAFRRAIALPDAAATDVEATYEEGVLKVVVPKAKLARTTKIKVAG